MIPKSATTPFLVFSMIYYTNRSLLFKTCSFYFEKLKKEAVKNQIVSCSLNFNAILQAPRRDVSSCGFKLNYGGKNHDGHLLQGVFLPVALRAQLA